MKKILFTHLLFLVFFCISPSSYLRAGQIRSYSIPSLGNFDAMSDEILVKFKENTPLSEQELLHSRLGGQVISRNHRLNFVKVQLTGGSMESLLRAYRNDPIVEIAEPNYIIRPHHPYELPREYLSLEELEVQQRGLLAINAHEAWDVEVGTGSATIAIIDSGVDFSHIELAENIWENPQPHIPYEGIDGYTIQYDTYGWNFVLDSNDPKPDPSHPAEDHGTHVAGIVAAVENGEAIVGVSWGNKILPLKALAWWDSDDPLLPSGVVGSYVDILNAITYAVDKGANVINLSLGAEWPKPETGIESIWNSAIDYCENNGVLVVGSAGNDGKAPVMFPAGLDRVLAVGACTMNIDKASFSNYGVGLDMVAPGENILSALSNDELGRRTGTSMAAPFVSGAASLVVSYFKRMGISWTSEELRRYLTKTSYNPNSYDWEERLGYGILDAGALMRYISRPQSLAPASGSSFSTTSVNFSFDKMKDASNYEFFISTTVSSDSAIYTDTLYTEKTDLQLSEGIYYWKLRAHYPNGLYSHWTDAHQLKIDTSPPTEVSIASIDSVYSDRITLLAQATDKVAGLGAKPFKFGVSRQKDLSDEILTDWVVSPYILDGLEKDTTYYLRLSARDGAGNISAWSSTCSVTTLDIDVFIDEAYSFTYEDGLYSSTVRVSSSAFTLASYGIISPPTPSQTTIIDSANSKFSPGIRTDLISPRDYSIKYFDDSPADFSSLSKGDILLSFTYPSSLSRAEENMLRPVRLNEATGTWEIMETFTINREEKRIETSLSSLSIYSLFMLPYSDFADFYIYPNPFIMGDSQFGEAAGGGGLVFANIPDEVEIKIFNSAGELIEKFQHKGGVAKRWTGVRDLSSGVYIGLLKTPDGKTISGKFSVVR